MVYDQNCASCHGPDGQGLVPNARNFRDVDYMRGETPVEIYTVIAEGRGNEMPAFGDVLTSDERWDVVYYIWRLSTDEDHLQRGEQTYQANCVTCHGSMAIQVLSPPDLEATCSACHNPEQRAPSPAPVAARYLLVLLGQVEFGIRVTEALAAKTPEPSMRQAATRYLRQAGNSMQRVREGWHSFDLGLVEEMLLQTADAARRADSSLAGGAKR